MLVSASAVGAVGIPVNAGEINGAFVERAVVIVVTKLASSPIAAAISFNVSRRAGAPSTRLDIAVFTYALSAITVVSTPTVIVLEKEYSVQEAFVAPPGSGG